MLLNSLFTFISLTKSELLASNKRSSLLLLTINDNRKGLITPAAKASCPQHKPRLGKNEINGFSSV